MILFKNLDKIEKIQVFTGIFLQFTLVGASVWAVWEGRWWVFFVSLFAFFATVFPFVFLRKQYNLFLPTDFQFVIVVFLYASLFLGEVAGYYNKFWWWDTLLHGVSGFALGFAGFLVLYILHLGGRLDVSPVVFAIFTFSFALSMGALWEIFEFFMDTFFGFNMQRTETGVNDTMYDLIVDSLGALAASLLGYKYIKNEKSGEKPPRLFRYLISKFLKKNPNILRDQVS